MPSGPWRTAAWEETPYGPCLADVTTRALVSVEVRRGEVPVRLARLASTGFTERLVQRFRLPVDGWRGNRR